MSSMSSINQPRDRNRRRGTRATAITAAAVAHPFFPDVVDALGTSFRDVVLDGELVVCRDGRLDFTAL